MEQNKPLRLLQLYTRLQNGEIINKKTVQELIANEKYHYIEPHHQQTVLDRLPTAQVISHDDNGWVVGAEVFGTGIEMWLRSQGELVERVE